MNLNIYTNSAYRQTHNSKTIINQAKLTFYSALYMKFGSSYQTGFNMRGKMETDDEFLSSSQFGSNELDIKGGSPTIGIGDWKTWLKSIPENPAVIYQVKFIDMSIIG